MSTGGKGTQPWSSTQALEDLEADLEDLDRGGVIFKQQSFHASVPTQLFPSSSGTGSRMKSLLSHPFFREYQTVPRHRQFPLHSPARMGTVPVRDWPALGC
jgi:hypothetical protein